MKRFIDHGGHAMPKDAMKLLVFDRFFRFSFDIFNEIKKKKKLAEFVFSFSRPIFCKNQENGAGKFCNFTNFR